ncbi:Ecdysteroid kinase-like family [Popillia japonica]|uniref:Ecdysteroid kinase-like family n=1 Tax=Popillia japonica TaxID=7064 RepID=A0AAW1K3A8_POPJA
MKYLIFDDLKSEGYQTLTPREPLSLDCVKLCLNAIVKLHCTSLIHEEKMRLKTGAPLKLHCTSLIHEEKMRLKTGAPYILSEEFPEYFKETFYTDLQMSVNMMEAAKKGVKTQIDVFGDGWPIDLDYFKRLACDLFDQQIDVFGDGWPIDLDYFKRLACDLFDQFREIVKPSNQFRNAICHGDLWSGNIMFKFAGDKPVDCKLGDLWSGNIMFKFAGDKPVDCKLIDFQSYRYGPPGQDFMAFVYFTTRIGNFAGNTWEIWRIITTIG